MSPFETITQSFQSFQSVLSWSGGYGGGYGGYHGYAAPAVVGGYGKAVVSPYAATSYGGYGHGHYFLLF